MTFTLDFLPPSANNAYINTKHGRILSPEAREWLNSAGLIMRSQKHGQHVPDASKGLVVAITLVGKWKTRANTWIRTDLDNRVKLLQDAAFAVMGLNDAAVISLTARKQHHPEQNKSIITIGAV